MPAQLQGDWYLITTDIPTHVITLTTTQYKLRGGGISSGDVVVNGDEIDFFNAEPCALPLPEGLGRYRWGLSGDVLSLTPLNEDLCPRSYELANQKYRRVPETSSSMYWKTKLVAQAGRYSNYLDKLKGQTDSPHSLTLVASQQRQDGQLPFALRRPQS